MADYESSTPTKVRGNQVITAQLMNEIVEAILGRIVGGAGIIVRRVGHNIVIELEEQYRR